MTNVLICAPIWQFISCFYEIPLEFGYFNPENCDYYNMEEKKEGEMTAEGETQDEKADDFA